MKKFLFVLLAAAATSSYAEIEQQVTFDFTKPEQLNPSITPASGAGEYVVVTDVVFHEGPISLSFQRGDDYSYAAIATNNASYNYANYLTFSRSTRFFISSEEHWIKHIEMTGNFTGEVASVDKHYFGGIWPNEEIYGPYDPRVHEVEFYVSGKAPLYDKFVVTYVMDQNTLVPTNVSLISGTSTYVFDGFSLSFDQNVKITGTPKMWDQDGHTVSLSSYVSGYNVSVKPDQEVIPGEYTIVIPEGTYSTLDGNFYNPELRYNITVLDPVNTFVYEYTEPEEGIVDEIPDGVKVHFIGDVGGITNKTIAVYNVKGVQVRKMIAELAEDATDAIVLHFTPRPVPLTEPGIYTIVIPEGVAYDMLYDPEAADFGIASGATCNPETVLTFNVGGVEALDPALLNTANALLACKGIGYPAEDSEARLTLETLVDTQQCSNAALREAIGAYYQTTDLTMPESALYYRIYNVATNGNLFYLQYTEGEGITLTTNPTKAAAFLAARNEDGTYVFQTPDGMYLHNLVLTDREGVTKSCVSAEYSYVNDLQLDKFVSADADSVTAFGMFSLYGTMGKINGEDMMRYAKVNGETGMISNPSKTPEFSGIYSSAFKLVQTEKPRILTEYTISPSSSIAVENLNYIDIAFKNATNVSYDSSKVITLSGVGGYIKYPTSVEFYGNEHNVAELTFGKVQNGNYTLTIPDSTFYYQKNGETVYVQPITATFTVYMFDDFKYDFAENGVVTRLYYPEIDGQDKADVDLNEFTILSYDYKFSVSDNPVTISRRSGGHVVKSGVLDPEIKTEYLEDGSVSYYYTKLILDTEITPGSIPDNEIYFYTIPAATIGDANFGLYLQDPDAVNKRDCHVNAKIEIFVKVDNSTGIREIEFLDSDKLEIYDMNGNRLQEIPERGFYIINGKKAFAL